MDEIKTLKDVQQFLNNISYINAGGCGIAALAMYRWLKQKKKLKKNTCIYFFYDDHHQYNTNKKYLLSNQGNPTSCSHAVLYHSGKFIDSKDFLYDISRYSYNTKITDEHFLIESLNNIDDWKSCFERDIEIPKIQKKLNIDLSDINYN